MHEGRASERRYLSATRKGRLPLGWNPEPPEPRASLKPEGGELSEFLVKAWSLPRPPAHFPGPAHHRKLLQSAETKLYWFLLRELNKLREQEKSQTLLFARNKAELLQPS